MFRPLCIYIFMQIITDRAHNGLMLRTGAAACCLVVLPAPCCLLPAAALGVCLVVLVVGALVLPRLPPISVVCLPAEAPAPSLVAAFAVLSLKYFRFCSDFRLCIWHISLLSRISFHSISFPLATFFYSIFHSHFGRHELCQRALPTYFLLTD